MTEETRLWNAWLFRKQEVISHLLSWSQTKTKAMAEKRQYGT